MAKTRAHNGFQSREEYLAYHKAWRDKNRVRLLAQQRESRLRRIGWKSAQHRVSRYGVDAATYAERVKAQGGKCAICDEVPSGNGSMGVLHIDHDHATGELRDLLCHKCNKALGGFKDSQTLLAKAGMYLSRHAKARNSA